jgi:hypothetical protein
MSDMHAAAQQPLTKADLLAAIASLRTEFQSEFHSCMDGFTSRVEDFDYSAAKNRARLDDHKKRLTALEKKPS